MGDKDILLNNVRNWYRDFIAVDGYRYHALHKQPVEFWLELNERAYDGLAWDTIVLPEPKCSLLLGGQRIEVEALPRRMKVGFGYGCNDRPFIRAMAAQLAFEFNMEMLNNPPTQRPEEQWRSSIFLPYLLAFTSPTFLNPDDYHVHVGIRSRYGKALKPR